MNNTIYLILISFLSILSIVTLLWLYCVCCYICSKKNNHTHSIVENNENNNCLREAII